MPETPTEDRAYRPLHRQHCCAFSGHRPAKLPWGSDERDARCLTLKRMIADATESAVAEGFTHFLCGMAEGCDMYFAEAVIALRKRMQQITLEAVIPCPTQSDHWSPAQQRRYQAILDECDYETLVQQTYTRGCMQRRNRYMVDHAALLLSVCDGQSGGTRATITYALQQGVPVVDIPLPRSEAPS